MSLGGSEHQSIFITMKAGRIYVIVDESTHSDCCPSALIRVDDHPIKPLQAAVRGVP